MAAIVERDDAAAVLLQFGNPGRIYPVHILARGKAMHEQDRIALAFVEIGNFNSAVVKTRHRSFRIFGGCKFGGRCAPSPFGRGLGEGYGLSLSCNSSPGASRRPLPMGEVKPDSWQIQSQIRRQCQPLTPAIATAG